MVFKEPTTEPKLVMVSSPRRPTHQSTLALSSPPTPSFDSQPSGPSSPLVSNTISPPLTPSHPSGPYPESYHLALASSLLKLLDEKEEEFHHTFGHLEAAVERLKRDNAKREEVIKFKRDNMVMLDNLIRMQEKDVENLKTLVSNAKAGGRKELPLPVSEADLACTQNSTVSPPKVSSRPDMTPRFAANILPLPIVSNGSHQLPCAPTSLSLRPFHTLSAQSRSVVSNESNSVPDRGVSRTGDMPARKVAKVEKKASGEDAKKMTKVGAGDIPAWKMAKVDRQVSRAGEVPVKKVAKVVGLKPEDDHTLSTVSMVSTPFKGRVGLTKNFKGKLHNVMIVNSKRPSSSSPALLSMTRRKSPLKAWIKME